MQDNLYLSLTKKHNFRDFRELENIDGKHIKPWLFLRSCSLDRYSPKEIAVLKSQGLKTIIDLRTELEAEQKPEVKIDGVENIFIPLIDKNISGITHEKGSIFFKIDIPNMPNLYKDIFTKEKTTLGLKKVFEIICDVPKDGAVLWHCSEGKDRCGIVSALLLLILDFDLETVIEDYLRTNDYNMPKGNRMYRFLRIFFGKSLALGAKNALIADRSYIMAMFDDVCNEYGSMQNYLRTAIGITNDMKERLKSYCLE